MFISNKLLLLQVLKWGKRWMEVRRGICPQSLSTQKGSWLEIKSCNFQKGLLRRLRRFMTRLATGKYGSFGEQLQ